MCLIVSGKISGGTLHLLHVLGKIIHGSLFDDVASNRTQTLRWHVAPPLVRTDKQTNSGDISVFLPCANERFGNMLMILRGPDPKDYLARKVNSESAFSAHKTAKSYFQGS